MQIQIAKVKVLQILIASTVEISCQNSKDLVDQSDIAFPSTDDFPLSILKILGLIYLSKIPNNLIKILTYNRKVCTFYKWF